MSRRISRTIVSCVITVMLFASAAGSQEMSPTDRNFLSLQVQSVLPRAPIEELIIETELTLPGSALYAKRVVFKEGGVLVIDGATVRAELPVVLAIKELSIETETSRGRPQVVVRWPNVPEGRPGERGQPGDDRGSREGRPGADGGAGQPGGPGANGKHAPAVILIAGSIKGRLVTNLSGQSGAKGGPGGEGGRGGAGGYGNPASQSAFDCRRGPGNGQPGGKGGAAGSGGQGGNAGNGGVLIAILSDPAKVQENTLLLADAGNPGLGGEAGRPGIGGSGGRVGQEALRLP
ncbi:hypothetical protein ACKWRH_10765 [Bradyrhizobium sp. Pa8]|uniref:hypothetical protein n=1 Tax=Bradyrhizobium sp. Pa8 TaxID=3386552 RepID=UPI00403F2520